MDATQGKSNAVKDVQRSFDPRYTFLVPVHILILLHILEELCYTNFTQHLMRTSAEREPSFDKISKSLRFGISYARGWASEVTVK